MKDFANERDFVFSKYNRLVNMTYYELLEWSKNPCSKKASLDRKPIRRNLRLLKKQKQKWSKKDLRDAKKTISFIARHKNQPSGKIVKGCGISKRTISLRNWAFDPLK